MKIYSLSKYQVCNIVLLTIITMLYSSRPPELIHLALMKLFTISRSPLLQLTPRKHHSTLSFCVFHYFRFHIWDDLSFCFRLTSLSIVSSSFIQVVTNGKSFFFLSPVIFHFTYILWFLFFYLFVDTHICLHILTIINNAAVNMRVQISHWDTDSITFEYISRSGIAGSCYSSSCNFLRNLHSLLKWLHQFIFDNSISSRVPFSTHSCQHLLSFVFLIVAIITSMGWYFTMALIFTFLIWFDFLGDFEYFFTYHWQHSYLLWINVYSNAKILIRFLDFVWIPSIVWILALYEVSGLQTFSPIL